MPNSHGTPPASDNNGKSKKKVKFDRLYIRTHKYILGDNPSVTYGPPLSMAWEPLLLENCEVGEPTRRTEKEEIYEVEEYERIRPRRKVTYRRPGHRGPSLYFLVLSQVKREELLERMDVDKKSIEGTMREVNRVKGNRW
eukprot:CAMPEP_0198151742 /NCGR_PEP_ID=MMETSP1443-20131203/56953_1 /TAXON_ID=186043 /ORGANISM="Entomoneis sp., Strain CCMP2396" /LENGTH=139 /DNA_ID=CAMNT_0043817525 /DNA_START=45 /DNA_END=461 /DNA_ORIENTATION=-